MNTVFLQIRPEGGALYKSSLEPWSYWLSGKSGKGPSDGYDPLEFAIKEAHDRGLELHAWINPFRVKTSGSGKPHPTHPFYTKAHLLLKSSESTRMLDPGIPETRAYVIKVALDIVERYSVDGLHLDDYFYPYPKKVNGEKVETFDDSQTFKKYGQGFQDVREWRRQNINTFIQSLYASVKALKPNVKVGVSPFGIWRPGSPEGVEAFLDAYDDIGVDAKKWLNEGWLDYLMPQLYWRIEGAQSFSALAKWWHEQNLKSKPLYFGIDSTRIENPNYDYEGPRDAHENIRQIELARTLSRKYKTPPGHSHWSMEALRKNRGGLNNLLKETYSP